MKKLILAIICLAWPALQLAFGQTVSSDLTLKDSEIKDQDDMCIWLHPTDLSKSTIITSDKAASKLFIYDLEGNTLEVVPISGKPGNIDTRYNFPFGGQKIDIVAFNNRGHNTIEVYKVNPQTRGLEKIDDGSIKTGSNYGFCLYHSPQSGKFYGFTTSKSGNIEQYELMEKNGRVTGQQVRAWAFKSITEGCVCDDETGQAYFAEESKGIWKIGAEPKDGTSPKLIAKVGDASGLESDVEGLTIYYAANGKGYIIASSQGASKFTIVERTPPHAPAGEFSVSNVKSTDGIDVINLPLNSRFSQGIFVFHNGRKSPYSVGVVRWDEIASTVGGLRIDTHYWDPRTHGTSTSVSRQVPRPVTFSLLQNYPNPFNPSTRIDFSFRRPTHARLVIFNALGQ
ncbi:MAG: phytase, partial [Calditrichaeota bacterium]